MSFFDQYIQHRVLSFKFLNVDNGKLFDHLLESGQLVETGSVELRNVCAKLSVELAERLDNTLSVIDMSKRQFIEMALIEALDKVDQAVESLDAFQFHRGEQGEAE
jgi:hypothetical protein